LESKRKTKRLGLEQLQRIIELCKSVEERGLDPFLVDVDDIIEIIRRYFPKWDKPEQLCLDAEALNRLASVIKLQGEWVKHRSTSLYTDPFLLEEKIRKLDIETIVEIFLKSWRPIVEFEQISPHSLAEAINYWKELLPLDERWKNIEAQIIEAGVSTREELIEQRLLEEKTFTERVEALWNELKERVGGEGKIRYWDFIGADTFKETVQRAYLTSFMVTHGYAKLEIYPLEDEVYIKPNEKPVPLTKKKRVVSIPFPISREDWIKWKKVKENEQKKSIILQEG